MYSLKNYYAILELEPSASVPEIKKAYRKLALRYHPDKNNSDIYAAAQFAEIKEAYEVLTNPAKKEYYLQQRWYNQSMGYRKTQNILTPESLLKQSIELEKYVSRLDVFRMDKEQLQAYLLELLSEDTVEKINQFEETATNKSIIHVLLKAIQPLPAAMAAPVLNRILVLAGTDEKSINQIRQHQEVLKKSDTLEKYTPLGIAILTLLLCILMWLMSR